MAAAHHVLAHSSEAEVRARAAAAAKAVLSVGSTASQNAEAVITLQAVSGKPWNFLAFKKAFLNSFGPGGSFVGAVGEYQGTAS